MPFRQSHDDGHRMRAKQAMARLSEELNNIRKKNCEP